MKFTKVWAAAIAALETGGFREDVEALKRAAVGGSDSELDELLADLINHRYKVFNCKFVPRPRKRRTAKLGKSCLIALKVRDELDREPRIDEAIKNVAEREGVSDRQIYDYWTPLSRKLPEIFGKATMRPRRRPHNS